VTTHRVRRTGAVHLTFVDSDNLLGHEYEIARLPSGDLACACVAFAFNRRTPKTCKHIEAYQGLDAWAAKAATEAPENRHMPQSVVQAKAAAETFTFRRAMSFGKIPTGGKA
jgi:hypothetical protein